MCQCKALICGWGRVVSKEWKGGAPSGTTTCAQRGSSRRRAVVVVCPHSCAPHILHLGRVLTTVANVLVEYTTPQYKGCTVQGGAVQVRRWSKTDKDRQGSVACCHTAVC